MRFTLMIFCLVLFTIIAHGDENVPLESYPDHIQARLQIAGQLIDQHEKKLGRAQLQGAVERGRIWKPAATVTVAFLGGTDELVGKVANVAEEWTKHCNLKFSFQDESTGAFRRWSKTDTEFTADIRVGFDARGYWSLIGTDARDGRIARPDEPSLNLEQFDKSLPPQWESIVLHEFGHAIGFQHEHQHPVIPCDFRWEDDEGYVLTRNPRREFVPDAQNRRPGIYTVLAGPPNEWSRATVDFNLKPLTNDSSIYLAGPFDPKSIMLYALPDWMFKDGKRSKCYHSLNATLSEQDRKVASMAYPSEEALIRERIAAIEAYEKLKQED